MAQIFIDKFDPLSPTFSVLGIDAQLFHGERADQGGINITWTDQGPEVNLTFKVKWFFLTQFLRALRGTTQIADPAQPGGIPKVKRTDPWTLPINPYDSLPNFDPPYAWDRFVCTGTGPIQGIKPRTDQDGSQTGLAGYTYYEWAIVPATFTVPTYRIGADPGTRYDPQVSNSEMTGYPYTTTKMKSAGEVFCPDIGTYSFINNPKVPLNETRVGITISRTELLIKRHFMPIAFAATLMDYCGYINQEAIGFGYNQQPPGQLLLTSVETDEYIDVGTGWVVSDITLTIMHAGSYVDANGAQQPKTWNMFLDNSGNWNEIQDTNGNKPYRSVPMLPLIWPDYN